MPTRAAVFRHRWVRWAACLVVGLGLGGLALLRNHYQLVLVNGASMNPTLRHGDLLVVDRHAYSSATPSRDEVVVARHGDDWIVKRVVGLPGEILEVRQGRVWINGELRGHESERPLATLTLRPGLLTSGHFGLVGDNRLMPAAEHVHAVVDPANILGRVLLRLRLSGWARLT